VDVAIIRRPSPRSSRSVRDSEQNEHAQESMADFTNYIRQKTQNIIKCFDEAQSQRSVNLNQSGDISSVIEPDLENFDQIIID